MTLLEAKPALKLLSDEEIVERVRGGDVQLYEVIMRRYNQRLFRVARGIVRDDTEAEDVMQDAYVRAYVHLDSFAGESKFSTWLTRIVINEALARCRRRRRFGESIAAPASERPLMELLPSDDPGPEQRSIDREMQTLLEASIDALPRMYRSVLVLRDIEEMSTGETAECLALTEDTVKIRLHRARAMLRRQMFKRAGAVRKQTYQFLGHRCDRMVRVVLERIQES